MSTKNTGINSDKMDGEADQLADVNGSPDFWDERDPFFDDGEPGGEVGNKINTDIEVGAGAGDLGGDSHLECKDCFADQVDGVVRARQVNAYNEALFGKQQTRERQTEIDYTAIAMRLWRTYEQKVIQEGGEGASITPMGMVTWLIGRKKEWSKPTWRRYKSAVIYYLRSILGDAQALMASDHLEAVTSGGCMDATSASSARRIKNVGRHEFMNFLACFGDVYSPRHHYAGLTKTWMLMGSATGLRPHEWGQAELLRNVPEDHELVLSGHLKPGGTYLRVQNSKHTNGRANGAFRHLDVSGLPAEFWDAMDSLIRVLSDRVRYQAIYDNCRRFVADANRHFFGRDNSRRFHLYTSRHRFASEAKRSMSSEFVAAAMGHGSDQTAYSMYGNSRFSSGGLMVSPIEKETKTVKQHRQRKKPYEQKLAAEMDGQD